MMIRTDVNKYTGGKTIVEAFENAAIALIGYMCEIDKVEIDPNLKPYEFEVSSTNEKEKKELFTD
jgi:SHS2 domain-containing protein